MSTPAAKKKQKLSAVSDTESNATPEKDEEVLAGKDASGSGGDDKKRTEESLTATITQLWGTAREKFDEGVTTLSELKASAESYTQKVPTDKIRSFFSGDYQPIPESPEQAQATAQRLELVAKAFDGVKVTVGSKTIGLGADLALNYIPFGNRISQGAHLYILAEAVRWGADRDMLERMLGRIAMDTLASAVPLAGPFLDAMRLSHSKNARELRTLISDSLETAEA